MRGKGKEDAKNALFCLAKHFSPKMGFKFLTILRMIRQFLLLFLFNAILSSIKMDEIHKIVPLKELHIGALFPMESGSGGWPGGQACLPAVQMALEDVNLNVELLPNYALRLHHYNSKCQPGLAARQLFELLYNPPTKLILLSGCSPVTTMVAESAPVWNLVVLSYGASSPALSNRERFPTLFRTHPSANMQNPTRVHLFEKFKWKRITILQSVEEVFDSTAKDLEEQCRSRGIRVERHSFYGDPTDALKAIRRQDARIIVGLFYVTEARKVICQAYHHGLYGRKYVWFMIGWYSDTWFIPPEEEALNCSREEMEKAVQFHFTTESIMLSRDTMPTISGMTGQQFLDRLKLRIKTDPAETGGWPESPLAYDAVWALALMLNCTMGSLPARLSVEQFDYNNTKIAGKMFECMKNIQFRGVSGQVMFSDLGDRIARTQIEQMQNGKYVLLGYYDSSTQTLEWKKKEKFVGTRGPPPDSTRIKQWPITVNFKLYLTVMNFMLFALAFAIILFIFNRRYACRRIILQSQPECSNLLIIGSAICLLSLILMGFPTASASNGKPFLRPPSNPIFFTAFCHARLLILMIGFSLSYGSLFAKVWVAHKLGAAQKKRQLAAANINNNEEDSTSAAAIQLNSAASTTNPPPNGNPWDSIRNLLTAIVQRQTFAVAIRKLSQHSCGNFSSTSGAVPGKMSAKHTTGNLLNLPIHPARFYFVVGSLCLIDLLISLIWICFDPMRRKQIRFPLQEPTARMNFEDIMLLPVLELCQSQQQNVWTGIALGYKGLILLLGLFLSYDTRQLKIRYLNDLKSTLLSVCNVGVLCLLCGPIVVFFLRTQPNSFFCFVSATIFVCTCVSMGLVFGPKLLFIYRNPDVSKEEQNNQFQESTASQAEQLRYQQLLKENAELKRQIDMRNLKISECRRILEGHLLLINPKYKGKSGKMAPLPHSEMNHLNNNNNTEMSCLPSSSGGGVLEFEPTTISTAMEPTVITFLEHQPETSIIERETTNDGGVDEEEELMISGQRERADEEQPLAGDTGVCSDYDEENGDELMLTASSNEASSWEDDEGEEEEILL